MKRSVRNVILLCGAGLFTMPLLAQDMMVYPAKGQSQDQQQQDEYQCYHWAKDKTGFDPMQVPQASSPPPEQKGGAGGGLLKGAAAGAVVGAIAGDTAQGAAIGGALGGITGGARRRQSDKERAEWEQQQQQQYAAARNQYNRAYAACMEGRGYTVH